MNQSDVTHKIKECLAKFVDNKSEIDMATSYPDKSGKWSVKLQMFYNKHFPTDKDSYAVRLPVVALAISFCAIQIFLNLQWRDIPDRREYFIWAIIVLLSAATYGLYYGIKIGDRKQFTPWIVFKIIEILVTAVSLINTLIDGRFFYGYKFWNIILGLVITAGNLFLLSTVCRRKNPDLEGIQENADEFTPVIVSQQP